MLAIAHGTADRADAKWAGSVPQGPGFWQGTNPVAPMAATWQPMVLACPDELRPPPPPAFDSEATKAGLAEPKSFQRAPRTNRRAAHWEVFGGLRAHALWNEMARVRLLGQGDRLDAATSARVLAAINVAFFDAAIACWDAKYAYWRLRPQVAEKVLQRAFLETAPRTAAR